ncbi:sodium:solute symporter [bacterium]|nr:sodium:solute symporter [bacterium]
MPLYLLAESEPSPGISVMLALLLFIAASVWLGTMAQKAMDQGKFLEGFFLGNRGLGAWALALTATVQSGGTFMGFPSLVYAYGWSVALWIAGYMVVPLTGFAVVGKRVAQLSRRTGAVTVPDLLRERFASPTIGLVASLLIMFFMSFTMVAQFKAGATIMQLAWPGQGVFALSEDATANIDMKFLIGLGVFGVTVVGYTMIGGFLAGVWTDLFQSVMMVLGVMLLLCLVVPKAGGMEQANKTVIAQLTEKSAAEGIGDDVYVATPAAYMFGPGYHVGGREFLPLGVAVSMFVIWVYSGLASPASLVRVMAASSTEVMRKSILLLSFYNCLIYIPLVMICICARAILGDIAKPDEIIPRIALYSTQELPLGSFITGLILAAPFGAIMASVSCFVLVIASGLVQDIYVRFLRPEASGRELRLVTNVAMVVIGAIGILANLKPINFLQALVVFSGSAGAATFFTPVIMACYWKRTSVAGMLAGMLGGFGVYFGLYVTGWVHNWALSVDPEQATAFSQQILSLLGPDLKMGLASAFRPYFLLNLDPIIWGLLASTIAGIGVTLCTRPPGQDLIDRMFNADQPTQTIHIG